ncbi:MAG: methylaspartate mutase accessory protein GlmL [Eubacteriales bacterium]|nr:methylaspartate mutase accessory protein GlmL [Eubacteriales bacterium]
MNNILLVDFGSTYTKITLVDIEKEIILGHEQSWTTIDKDVRIGLTNAISILEEKIGKFSFNKCIACSSAAGGLRMLVSGLVPSLTAEAAKRASLGAGAKIIKTYSYGLTKYDVEEIFKLEPDIFLLAGGTDGGNSECVINSAKILSANKKDNKLFPIIIAGNRRATDEAYDILNTAGYETFKCENVMPSLGELKVEEVQECIRNVFIRNIVKAKGLDKAEDEITGVVLPTPLAVMEGIKLLSLGTKEETGLGELVAIDVGGATTDIYSIAKGDPTKGSTVLKGLKEPFCKRTVEGDIGMRYSIHGILNASNDNEISEISGLSEEFVTNRIEEFSKNTDLVPQNEEDEKLDIALAKVASKVALKRHSGELKEYYTCMGISYMQYGKDLENVRTMVLTGGSLIHTKKSVEIASYATYKQTDPFSLRPKECEVYVDRKYIIASMGLLSKQYPNIALRILKKELIKDGITK